MRLPSRRFQAMNNPMLAIDLTGKHALVAGVGDERCFGFAIAKALADAGAIVSVATPTRSPMTSASRSSNPSRGGLACP